MNDCGCFWWQMLNCASDWNLKWHTKKSCIKTLVFTFSIGVFTTERRPWFIIEVIAMDNIETMESLIAIFFKHFKFFTVLRRLSFWKNELIQNFHCTIGRWRYPTKANLLPLNESWKWKVYWCEIRWLADAKNDRRGWYWPPLHYNSRRYRSHGSSRYSADSLR